ncbi:MAG: anti-sigma factor domain-containing protein [Gaiellales bacterium]
MEHVDELMAAHALHALDPQDAQRVESHVAECAACRAKLRELEAVSGALAYAVPPAAPPPELRQRVLGAVVPVAAPAQAAPAARPPVRARRSWRWWPRFAAVAVPVLAAGVVGLVIWNFSLRDQLDSTRKGFATGVTLSLPGVGNAVADNAGSVTLYSSAPAVPDGKTYEAWVISSNSVSPAGLFAGGTNHLTLTLNVRPGDTIAITIEPAGGSPQPTRKPISSAKVTKI